jgi:hypothetical protein
MKIQSNLIKVLIDQKSQLKQGHKFPLKSLSTSNSLSTFSKNYQDTKFDMDFQKKTLEVEIQVSFFLILLRSQTMPLRKKREFFLGKRHDLV